MSARGSSSPDVEEAKACGDGGGIGMTMGDDSKPASLANQDDDDDDNAGSSGGGFNSTGADAAIRPRKPAATTARIRRKSAPPEASVEFADSSSSPPSSLQPQEEKDGGAGDADEGRTDKVGPRSADSTIQRGGGGGDNNSVVAANNNNNRIGGGGGVGGSSISSKLPYRSVLKSNSSKDILADLSSPKVRWQQHVTIEESNAAKAAGSGVEVLPADDEMPLSTTEERAIKMGVEVSVHDYDQTDPIVVMEKQDTEGSEKDADGAEAETEDSDAIQFVTKKKADHDDDDEDDVPASASSPDGRYLKFGAEIGRGSFKTVFKGLDTNSGVAVAWCELQV